MRQIPIDVYQNEIRHDICAKNVCFRRSPNVPDRCMYELDGTCPVFSKLEGAIAAVRGTCELDGTCPVFSNEMRPYEQRLNDIVCSKCPFQDKNGICDLRDREHVVPKWCLLDAYFPLLVQIIERVESEYIPPAHTS